MVSLSYDINDNHIASLLMRPFVFWILYAVSVVKICAHKMDKMTDYVQWLSCISTDKIPLSKDIWSAATLTENCL